MNFILLNSTVVLPADGLAIVEPLEANLLRALIVTNAVGGGQGADELGVADDCELLTSRERASGHIFFQKLLEGLSSVVDVEIGLIGLAGKEGLDDNIFEIFIAKSVLEFGKNLSLFLRVGQRENGPSLRLTVVHQPGEIKVKTFAGSLTRGKILNKLINIHGNVV